MNEQKERNKLTAKQKKEITEAIKIVRNEHPELEVVDLCTSMVYHYVTYLGTDKFATVEAIVVATKAFYDIEDTEEEFAEPINKVLN